MLFKTLIDKRTGEFVTFLDFNGKIETFTSNIPKTVFPETATFDDVKKKYETVDFSEYDFISCKIIDSNAIGADIKNKLLPLKNLVMLLKTLKNYNSSFNDKEDKEKIIKFAIKQLDECDKSINYISKLF